MGVGRKTAAGEQLGRRSGPGGAACTCLAWGLAVPWMPVACLSLGVRAQRCADALLAVGVPLAFGFAAALVPWLLYALGPRRLQGAGSCASAALLAVVSALLFAIFSIDLESPMSRISLVAGCACSGAATSLFAAGASRCLLSSGRTVPWTTLAVLVCWLLLCALLARAPLAVGALLSGACSVLAAFLMRMATLAVCSTPLSDRPRPANLAVRKVERLESAHALAALLLGFAFASMADCLSPLEPAKAMHWSWGACFAAVSLVALLYAVGMARQGEANVWFGLRLSLLFAIVAFFPFNALNPFGIRASFWSVEVAFVLATASLFAIVVEAARSLRGVATLDTASPVAALAVGTALGVVFSRQFLAQDETMVRIGGLTALLFVFCATNLVVKRERVRDILIVYAGKESLPVVTATAGRGTIEQACRLLAAEYVLSKRELDVLYLLARGYSLARVQEELFISEGTASTHRRHVYKKLDVRNKQQLIELVEMYQKGSRAS